MPTQPAHVQAEWKQWRPWTEGRCEAACNDRHDGRKGRRCSFSGAWDGKSGRVLCRVHQNIYDHAEGDFAFVTERG